MGVYKPTWFSTNQVMISTAPTCGLTKGGRALSRIDPDTGKRVQVTDPETGELVDAIDDQLLNDMVALSQGSSTDTLRFVPAEEIDSRCAVPIYYDSRYVDAFNAAMQTPRFATFKSASLANLQTQGIVEIRGGHGSPSHEERVGEVPYIKVSDLRAGQVNINPTNRVPKSVAVSFWGGASSGLRPYDLVCPERTSKNIGDFCVLMPGQEQVVMTKEVIVLRPGRDAEFDPFYLLWAMTLKIVRDQWRRIVFMQTNREDVGKRFLEIRIPIAKDRRAADLVSEAFRNYYLSVARARVELGAYLQESADHHFFVGGSADSDSPGES